MLTTTDIMDNKTLYVVTQTGSGVTPPLAAPNLILLTGSAQLSKKSVLADVQQPTFPGYKAAAVTFTGLLFNAQGYLVMRSSAGEFKPTDDTVPTTVTGYGITDTAGALLLAWEYFPQPIPIPGSAYRVGVIAEICLSNPPSGQVQTYT